MNNSAPRSQPNPTLVALLDQEQWNGTRTESNSSAEDSKNQSSALEGTPSYAPAKRVQKGFLIQMSNIHGRPAYCSVQASRYDWRS